MTGDGLSTILYPAGVSGQNSCTICFAYPLANEPDAILHSIHIVLTLKMSTTEFATAMVSGSITLLSNPNKGPIESSLVKSTFTVDQSDVSMVLLLGVSFTW